MSPARPPAEVGTDVVADHQGGTDMAVAPHKSKTVATWLALVGGAVGAHRFYLYGPRDWFGWLHPWPTLIGVYGVMRLRAFGLDDQLSWALVPVLGLVLAGTMLMALIYGLMPDERWDARYNPQGRQSHSGWGAVIGVVCALFFGSGFLMATLAFGGEHYFLWQIEEGRRLSS